MHATEGTVWTGGVPDSIFVLRFAQFLLQLPEGFGTIRFHVNLRTLPFQVINLQVG